MPKLLTFQKATTTKACLSCKIEKALVDFPKRLKGSKDGFRNTCSSCRKESDKRRRQENIEKYKQRDRAYYIRNISNIYKTKYGISLEDYNILFDKQQGKCKCCNMHQQELKAALAVDHCHTTGIIRGLLCKQCNLALGNVKDNIQTLKNMIEYLKHD
jgi:hypothetical protein